MDGLFFIFLSRLMDYLLYAGGESMYDFFWRCSS
ncbi:hypothetical protein FITA111629_12065 [Filibacter tadaridae]|uniref:Uncharacterized protein n=1 Tax=Filibacter tadaridae TaxID=2483811 RepID=A0A3P5WCN8_9BACL|nr:hypothetical protein FILTAD_00088 [Filibacter tadaridae]